jgi:hypothetical protein
MAIQQGETITAQDISDEFDNVKTEFDNHKTSGDHDGRYYTETETDTKLALLMPKAGGTFTGNVSMGNYILTVPTPSLP